MKILKLALTLSLPAVPNPVVGSGFWKLNDQPLKVPVAPLPVAELVMTRVHVPLALRLSDANTLSGICGLKVAKNGALPFWMGVVALSSKMVLVKFAVETPLPTPLNNGTETWLGCPIS